MEDRLTNLSINEEDFAKFTYEDINEGLFKYFKAGNITFLEFFRLKMT